MAQIRIRMKTLLAGLLGSALGAGAAAAADGVIEINQARALAGGVSATDAPGFPVTIDTAGSYALTGNLSVGGLDTTGISITTSDVTLDLRGFSIQGACPLAGCALGTGNGIGVFAIEAGIQLRDGRIRGFASDGVLIGPRSRAAGLVVERNGRDGIDASGQIDIVDTTANQNALFGIEAGAQAKIRNSVADANGQGGITTSGFALVSDSATRNNQLDSGISFGSGIRSGTGCLIQGNATISNEEYGIDAEGRGSLVLDNIASGNGKAGVFLLNPGSVQSNTSNNNVGAGLSLPPTGINRAGYRENVVNNNSGGTASGGINIGGNSCNGTGSCP